MKNLNCWQYKFITCRFSKPLLYKIISKNQYTEPKVDLNKIKKAIYYAKKYHGTQKRDSGEPYYSHPLEVAFMVADYCFKTDILVASILHDVLEDTNLSKEKLQIIFGNKIADYVDNLTRIKCNTKISPAKNIELLWNENKKDLLYIKYFDRHHNMETVGVKPLEKIKTTVQETIETFIILGIYLEIGIEKELELQKLCYNYFNLYANKSAPPRRSLNHLSFSFVDNFQLSFPAL